MFSIDEHLYKSIDDILDKDIKFIKSNKKIEYMNVPCSFDTETSSFYTDGGEKRGIVYIWVLGINGKCITGRTYDEFIYTLNRIVEFYELSEKRRMIIYVHNLAFDFQFFHKWFKWKKVFATEEREPLYALRDDGIEIRCSYRLSGYNLENVGKNLTKYKIEKMVGDLDYSLIRHSKTPLSDKEMGYVIHDALVVMCYIQEEIESFHNNITLIPSTKTGKVRVYIKRCCLYSKKHHGDSWKFQKYHNMMKALPIVSINEYNQLKNAFHGGFTHANSFMVNKIINNVHSFDFTSSYPYVIVSEQFPMGKGELITIKSKEEFERNLKLYCCLFDCIFEDIESSIPYEHPISISKCISIQDYGSDNGRLIFAKRIKITITEQDFAIIRKYYKWKHLRVNNFRRYKKNYLPTDFVKAVLDLYQKKTLLKDVEDSKAEYMNAKEMLNSCYGMMVTDVCRTEIDYSIDGNWGKIPPIDEELIQKYNEKKTRFICYQWGVWVTAYAMRNLFTAIYELGTDYIYSDTDSVKFINLEKHQKYFDNYNENVMNKLKRSMDHHGIDIALCSPKTIKGETKTIGVWNYDGFYYKFKTLGAKRYMVLTEKGYSLTVSGLRKEITIPYLLEKYGDNIMDEFKDGMIIPPGYTGKQIHSYIDFETSGTVIDYLGNECEYHELSSIHLENSGYELSLSREFTDYLLGIKLKED